MGKKKYVSYEGAKEDSWAYYKKHYDGLGRSELQKSYPGLYAIMRENGDLKKIPRKNSKQTSSHTKKENPMEYYERHYDGLSRIELSKADSVLYKAIKKAGEIEKIPTKQTQPDFDKNKHDPWSYYSCYYSGLGRTDLYQTNSGLYNVLKNSGDLEKIPRKIALGSSKAKKVLRSEKSKKKEKKEKSGNKKSYKTALDEYKKKYSGLSRSELHIQDRRLYNQLAKSGELKYIRKKQKTTEAKKKNLVSNLVKGDPKKKKKVVEKEESSTNMNIYFTGEQVEQILYGLHELKQGKQVYTLVEKLADRIPDIEDFTAKNLANSVYNLASLEKEERVYQLLSALTEKVALIDDFSGETIGTALYGLHRLGERKEVYAFLDEIIKKID